MSHVTTGTLKITDLDALAEAAAQCGLVLRRGQRTWRWYGRWMNDYHGAHAAVDQGFSAAQFGTGEHALVLADPTQGRYDIGVVRARDGNGYELLYDSYGPDGQALERAAGPQLSRLKQEYAAAVAVRRARSQLRGWTVRREQDGVVIKIKLRRLR